MRNYHISTDKIELFKNWLKDPLSSYLKSKRLNITSVKRIKHFFINKGILYVVHTENLRGTDRVSVLDYIMVENLFLEFLISEENKELKL